MTDWLVYQFIFPTDKKSCSEYYSNVSAMLERVYYVANKQKKILNFKFTTISVIVFSWTFQPRIGMQSNCHIKCCKKGWRETKRYWTHKCIIFKSHDTEKQDWLQICILRLFRHSHEREKKTQISQNESKFHR